MTPQPKAIFFDMDGTLLDWQTAEGESWRDSCVRGYSSFDGAESQALFDAILVKRDWFWSDRARATKGRMDLLAASTSIVRDALRSIGHDLPDLAANIALDYRTQREDMITPFPGAIELLESLRQRGTTMALITNGAADSQRRSVERFGLTRYFDCIVIEGEFGVGKPDVRVFRHALTACGVDPGETWMVGDNIEADIVTPHALGMHTVWVDAESRGLPVDAAVRPHRVIRAIGDLLER
jgi:putative hydrolase of the HAD superfamily